MGMALVVASAAPLRAQAGTEAKEFVEKPLLGSGEDMGHSEAAQAINAARGPASAYSDKVGILADKIDHLKGRDYVIATGSVDINYQTTNLKADRVEINTKTGDVVAEGNVVISSEGSLIRCQKAIFNIYTKRGFMFDADGFASPVYYFTGKRIEKVGDDKLRIHQGTLTSCGPACGTGPSPWTFRVGEADLQLDRYAHLYGFVPKILDVPLFYLPYYVASIKTKRATGFLAPVVGSDSTDGIFFINQFFWAINPSMDATFGLDYLSNRGTRYTGEFRYVIDSRSSGQFNASYLKDGEFFNQSISRSSWLFDDERSPNDLPLGGEFYSITLDHKQVLAGDVEMVGRMDLGSEDTNFDREFSDDIVSRTRREMESFVSFSKSWETRSIQVVAERLESLEDNLFTDVGGQNLIGDEEEVFGRLPSVEFLQQTEQIDSTPLYFDMVSSWTNFFEEREIEMLLGDGLSRSENMESTPRFDLYPRVSLPITVAPWLSFTPSVAFRETFWWRSRHNRGEAFNVTKGLSREAFELALDVRGPTVYRTYNYENRWAEKYKHIVEPNFSYRYVSDFDEADSLLIPISINGGHFDSVDTFDRSRGGGTVGVNELSYGITSRILAKNAEGEVAEIFRLSVVQPFDIKEKRKDERSDLVSLGNIEFDLESRVIPPVILNFRSSYNYFHKRPSTVNGTVGLELARYGMIYTDYTFSQDPATGEDIDSFFSGAVGVNATDNLHLQYRLRYDENEGRSLESQYILVYRGCCWGIQFTLFDRLDQTKLLVMLDLRGIGTVSRKFRVGSDLGGKRKSTGEQLPDTLRQSLDSNLNNPF
jgi:lipopolysaccharide assembly outer membrane protein LptD (OstA)